MDYHPRSKTLNQGSYDTLSTLSECPLTLKKMPETTDKLNPQTIFYLLKVGTGFNAQK